ncbi:putative S-adenosyl-L-methionine-dependent methyltransferase MAV-5150 [Porphyridium purpureum]|uniref:Putative S-adenosyl-L-methionine-dependent methyltransferase MAV-5150 n=1 Tax=Porphyridium purpureum TaxID=35688 RepID=A0A5J4YNK6_PORPP|nr:putative S-adenosyl-L-methionine-dependent methyltransferase MAV-5150 [Porphyridium purpureum]|eukprot:POR5597..scf222_8
MAFAHALSPAPCGKTYRARCVRAPAKSARPGRVRVSASAPSSFDRLGDVESTSLITSFWRARESEKDEETRLVYDESARLIRDSLMSKEQIAKLESSAILELATDLLAIRSHVIDELIDSRFGIKDKKGEHHLYYQMVHLGIGMCTRHYTRLKNLPKNATVFEIDSNEVLEARVDVLDLLGCPPKCIIEPVPCADVGVEFALLEALAYKGYRADLPTIFVAEGLLEYMSPEQLDAMFGSIARIAADGSMFIAQVLEPSIIDEFRRLDPEMSIPFQNIPPREQILSHMNAEADVWHEVEFLPYDDLGRKLGRPVPHVGNILTALFEYKDEE